MRPTSTAPDSLCWPPRSWRPAPSRPKKVARLLAPAGAALAKTVAAVARSLGWLSGELPLAAAGGYVLSATAVCQALLDGLAERGYQPALTLVTDPVRGALILAERAMNASEH